MGRPSKPEGERVRDIAPTGVRLPPGLRDALVREAAINGRSLNAEILFRLSTSLSGLGAAALAAVGTVREAQASYSVEMPESHRQLLALFNALTPDRQLALLTLLRR